MCVCLPRHTRLLLIFNVLVILVVASASVAVSEIQDQVQAYTAFPNVNWLGTFTDNHDNPRYDCPFACVVVWRVIVSWFAW